MWWWMLACASNAPENRPPDAPIQVDRVVEAPLQPGEPPTRIGLRGDRIVAIGGDLPAPELSGDLVTAGFVDAHGHVDSYGKARAALDLAGAATYADTLARVHAAPPADGWLVGRGWDQNDWPDAPAGSWPLAADLDDLSGARPVILTRVDGHAVWLNTAALRAAGIDRDTPDPAGGQVVRDAQGAPTGVLIDNAVDLVKVPPPTPEERERRVLDALSALASVGLTGIHDMGTDDATLEVLERLDRERRLPIRVWSYLMPDSAAAERLFAGGPWRGDRLAVVGIKAFADGALGSRGALLTQPYRDLPDHRGLAVTPLDDLIALTQRAVDAGADVAIHGIGDLGVRNALDAFSAARGTHQDRRSVLRVEHAQVVHPGDVPRFAAYGVIASMQPTHCTSDMPWAEARLGPERVRWAYTWDRFLQAGVPLAFGSDVPVEDPHPTLGLWAATTRTDASGAPGGGWYPDERVTLQQTIDAYTRGAAAAVHEEGRLGEIAVDRVADLTVWRRDGDRWRPAATVVDGNLAWRADR